MCLCSNKLVASYLMGFVLIVLAVWGDSCQPRERPKLKEGVTKTTNNDKVTNDKDLPLDVEDRRQVGDVFHTHDYDERAEKNRQYLINLGEKMFPMYEKILSDPNADAVEISGVIGVICKVRADRRRFLKHALTLLKDKREYVRTGSLELLQKIGSPSEAPAVVKLLSDEEWDVVNIAAKTLTAIGGPKELGAMEDWLKNDSRSKDPLLRERFQKYCDSLKKRLDDKAKDPSK